MSSGRSPSRPVYSIGAVAKMLGLPAATLRTWQERYTVVVPERSPGGHRLFSRDQVEQLRFVVDRVADGLSPGDAHRLLRDRLADGASLEPGHGAGVVQVLILLAEQEPFAAEFAEYFLRTEGYQVALARTDQEAIAAATENPPSVAVVDLLISGGRGVELCRRLTTEPGVPVVAVSNLDTRDRALSAGASAFLLKPIEPLQLVSTINDLIGRSAFLRPMKQPDRSPT